MRWDFLGIVAGLGALLHLGFAYQEVVGWGPAFVRRAAGAWMRDPGADDAHVAWARPLAANMGAYNLVLAVGLAWTAVADVGMAAALQGSLGLLLGLAALAR